MAGIKLMASNFIKLKRNMRLMFLHPRGQPMQDSKVDDAGTDQRGTGPP
jgi:hypothetical protein